MKYVFYVFIGVLVIWFVYKTFMPVKGLKTLTADQFAQESKGHVIVDVREVHEYRNGHLVKAVNIPLSQLEKRLSEIPKTEAVYLYCQSGMRSKKAADILVKNGYSSIYHLQGGIMAWKGQVVR